MTIGNLTAGTYTVTISDNAGGTASATTVVTQPNTPVFATIINQTNPSCNGFNDGSATVSGSGGTPGYFYNWSNGSNSATISNLSAGTYTVTVFDNNQCTSTQSITLNEPTPIVANPATNEACDQGNGTATFNLSSLNLSLIHI